MRDKIKILDVVAVVEEIPEHGLKRGEVGTVVDRWKDGTFEVEFSDDTGEAYAFVALHPKQIMPLYYRKTQNAQLKDAV